MTDHITNNHVRAALDKAMERSDEWMRMANKAAQFHAQEEHLMRSYIHAAVADALSDILRYQEEEQQKEKSP